MIKLIRISVIQSLLLLILYNSVFAEGFIGEREWLLQPVSARSAAMGKANVALIEGANTVFWNPGGTAFLDGFNISCEYDPHTKASSIDKYNILSFSSNLEFKKIFNIGINMRKFYSYEDLPSGGQNKREYDIGISLGYKRKNIAVGINTKYLHTKNWGIDRGRSFAFDIGTLYLKDITIKKSYLLSINAAISLLNISNGIKYQYNIPGGIFKSAIPNNLKIGYSCSFKTQQDKRKLTFLTITHNLEYSDIINKDKDEIENSLKSMGVGLEFLFYDIISLRLGYNFASDKNLFIGNGLAYGFGFNIPLNKISNNIPLTISYDIARYPFALQSPYNYNIKNKKLHSLNINYIF